MSLFPILRNIKAGAVVDAVETAVIVDRAVVIQRQISLVLAAKKQTIINRIDVVT